MKERISRRLRFFRYIRHVTDLKAVKFMHKMHFKLTHSLKSDTIPFFDRISNRHDTDFVLLHPSIPSSQRAFATQTSNRSK